jgi:DNA-binding CsgD family transcriptional regulator
MKDPKTSSYFDFLKHSRNRLGVQFSEAEKILLHFDSESLNNNFFPTIYYVSDYIENTNCFRPFSTSHFLGYSCEFLLKTDVLFLNRIRNREDMKIFDEQIFRDQMAFLASHKQEMDVKYTFTTNFRIKNGDDSWSSVVQCTHYLFNEYYRMPIASINSLTDLTYFKNDSKINHLIERHEAGGEKSVIENRGYFLQKTEDILSKREIDVLKLASQGMGSKEIADQLHISINTINNHRRNMLIRSKCKNFLQLVDIAVKNGVL